MSKKKSLPIKVFDFFSGSGGSCIGFHRAGLEVIYALDNNKDARSTFTSYPPFRNVITEPDPIEEVKPVRIRHLIKQFAGYPVLFSGCAPCQPFSKQNRYNRVDDKRRPLLLQFLKFIIEYLPDYVFVENVAGIQSVDNGQGPLGKFVSALEGQYSLDAGLVLSQDYGVPQKRRRYVLIASRLGKIKLPAPTHGPRSTSRRRYRFVRDAISDLPTLSAGEQNLKDPMHWAANLSVINLERIRCCQEGEGREKWPPRLRLACHANHKGHSDVYGRLTWESPASALTTRCISLSNGRFGHPEQDRAISIREAALLQTFPRWYIFHGSKASIARQIGNAVPPRLAEVFGRHFVRHYKENCSNG